MDITAQSSQYEWYSYKQVYLYPFEGTSGELTQQLYGRMGNGKISLVFVGGIAQCLDWRHMNIFLEKNPKYPQPDLWIFKIITSSLNVTWMLFVVSKTMLFESLVTVSFFSENFPVGESYFTNYNPMRFFKY